MHDDAERRDSTAVVNFGGDCVVTPSATAVGCDIDEPKSGSDNVPSRAEQRTDCDFRDAAGKSMHQSPILTVDCLHVRIN
jgi:hypothetical protein